MTAGRKYIMIGDPAETLEDAAMEFRLTYEGRLASAGSPQHKHDIRRVFHRQLKSLWDSHPTLRQEQAWGGKFSAALPKGTPAPANRLEEMANYYRRGNFQFVPLVFDEQRLLCHLDILFLRPGTPGEVLNRGDIDNRMKTLFDALTIPQGFMGHPTEDETPLFVLLEDDSLVTRVSVETDQLLQPTGPDSGKQDTRLVITVRLTPYVRLIGTMGF